jgi:DNA-binding Lrp family transcriptional regulator
VGLSATPVWRRVKELEDRGVIRGQVVLVDREKIGLSICVLANVSLVRHSEGAVEQFERLVGTRREIIECHAITGEADYVIKVVAADMKAYDLFLQQHIFKLPGVSSVRSNVVLREVKYETALPVG